MGTGRKAGDSEEIQVLGDISESEEISRCMEELTAPGEEGNRKKKKKKQKQETGHRLPEGGFHPVRCFKGLSRKCKIITVLVLAAVVLFGSSYMSGGKKDLGVPVAVMPLAKQDVQEKLTVSGPVSGTDSMDAVPNIHAEIAAMNVKEGDTVTEGQVLAVVDSTDLEREAQTAQNAYDLAVANKQEKDKEAVLGYEKTVQDFQKASLDHSENGQLFTTDDISQMRLEASANTLNDARRQMEGYTVENGRGVIDSPYGIQIQNAAFDLEKKKEELDDTQIKSITDDTMVRVNSKMGQLANKVEDDEPTLSIENPEQLKLEIKASELSIGKVKVEQMVIIITDILDGGITEGEIVKVSPTGEEKGGGSTERVIPATIQMDGRSSKLIAGITTKAELLIGEAKDVFVIPSSALSDDGEMTYIAIVQDMKVERISVTMGVNDDVVVKVIPTDGTVLEEGMQVIINPGPRLMDGAAVLITQ